MDNVALLKRTIAETNRLVDGTSDGQLDDPTPCEEWTVRDLINHLTGGSTMFAISAEQGSVPDDMIPQLMGGDCLGDDFRASFRTASDRAVAAFEQPGLMDKTLKLPFGELPAPAALAIAALDVATHTADLAKATNQSPGDESIYEEALALGPNVVSPEFRTPGVFDAEQPAAADAPASERLLAFAGRKV
jgi:uncharacterized protein (TIGR03086 family)